MPNFFKKIGSNVNNFFKKTEHGAQNFFQKTVPDVARKVANTVDEASDVANTAIRKVGNTLEKAAPIVEAVGAATGQPELVGLGAGLSNASQQASQIRGQLNQGSSQLSGGIKNMKIGK
jgi:hypothetical protein